MKRTPWQGTRQILQFNWPFYALLAPLWVGGWAMLRVRRWPRPLDMTGNAALGLGAWWALASVVVSWWVYDASPLMRWQWVLDVLPTKPRRWGNFHAGLDESTPALRQLLGGDGQAFDFFDADIMTEPSIRRARALHTPEIPPHAVDFRALPLSDWGLDATFVFFAAHEIRDYAQRERFFAELHRVLDEGGTLLIAEHGRDAANFAAFGPGAMHFFAPAEWEALASCGFETLVQTRITPFVRVWAWRKIG